VAHASVGVALSSVVESPGEPMRRNLLIDVSLPASCRHFAESRKR
jgi:hypothetical protein